MSKRKFSGENNLVIAYAHADRSEGGAKYGLSFDWRMKNKLQIAWADYLFIAKTCRQTNNSLHWLCLLRLVTKTQQNKRIL